MYWSGASVGLNAVHTRKFNRIRLVILWNGNALVYCTAVALIGMPLSRVMFGKRCRRFGHVIIGQLNCAHNVFMGHFASILQRHENKNNRKFIIKASILSGSIHYCFWILLERML